MPKSACGKTIHENQTQSKKEEKSQALASKPSSQISVFKSLFSKVEILLFRNRAMCIHADKNCNLWIKGKKICLKENQLKTHQQVLRTMPSLKD